MANRTLLLALLPLALLSRGVDGAHPNSSIAPKPLPPTPYGFEIMREQDDLVFDDEGELPIAGESLARYLEEVQTAQRSAGPYSTEQIQPLTDVGRAYQSLTRHPEAIRHFQKALHLMRVNEGLETPSQISLLRLIIDSNMAMGDYAAADRNREYLLHVHIEALDPTDEALADAAIEYTQWKREVYLSGYGGETYLRLLDMHTKNTNAIDRIAETDPYHPSQVPYLYQRMHAYYLVSQYKGEKPPAFQIRGSGMMGDAIEAPRNLEMERFRQIKEWNFRHGQRTLEKVVEILDREDPPDSVEQARARIALGDWYMWWDRKARAQIYYEEAYALLDQDGLPGTDPIDLFRDPVELPQEQIFFNGDLSEPEGTPAWARVRFDVAHNGEIKKIELLELDPPESVPARLALDRMLKQFRFRPIVRDGETTVAQSVTREYNYTY